MSRIMAHRGARNLWPENSLQGFREVAERGFDAVEFDVHLSDAGELLVIHDARLERTTDHAGLVREIRPGARPAIRLRGPDGTLTEETLPTLDDVLALFADYPGVELWVELKSDEAGRPYPGIVPRAAEALRRHGMADRAALHSFDIAVVREARATAPEMKSLISVNADWAARQGGIAALLAEVEGLVDIVGIHHQLFEAEFDTITRLRPLAGCSVWTVNDPDLMRLWLKRAPGFVVSDDPVALRDLMAEAGDAGL